MPSSSYLALSSDTALSGLFSVSHPYPELFVILMVVIQSGDTHLNCFHGFYV